MSFFYLAEKLKPDEVHSLPEQDSRHCIKVLRKKTGDQIMILNGMGIIYTGIISKEDPRKCRFKVVEEKTVEPDHRQIHLSIAPTKNLERIEWLVEKVTELGVSRISFIQCQNSERNKMNTGRLRRKAVSAIKQSGNPYLPAIDELVSFQEFINYPFGGSRKFLAHSMAPLSLMREIGPDLSYVILVGPEGGFSSQEIKDAETNRFEQVKLSSQVLRTETAGLVACALLSSK